MVSFQKISSIYCETAAVLAACALTNTYLPSASPAVALAFLAHLALKNYVPSRSFTAEKKVSEPEDIYERKYEEGELKEEENTPGERVTKVDSQAQPYRTTLSPETFEYIDRLVQEIRIQRGLPLRKPIQSKISQSVSEEKYSKESASENKYAELENLPEYLRETDSSNSLVDEISDAEDSPRLLEAAYYADLD